MIDDMIRGLDDARAVRVLKAFAKPRLHAGGEAETTWTPELEQALRREFPAEAGAARAVAVSVSEGDLARQALLLLADDPQNREALTFLIENPPPQQFEFVTAGTVALITAALIALQTHVSFERDKDGKFEIKVEKQPTSENLLTTLVGKILGFGAGK